ncbi:MAG: ATP-binding protein, partial [Trueperaceae bacterium]|nr:ATP-binding protein [Trueperaceae bacterium]
QALVGRIAIRKTVWYDYTFGANGFVVDAYGLGFAVFTAASYLMFLIGLALLLGALWYRPRTYWGQRTILTGLTLAPLIANVLYLSGVVGGIDLSPVGLAIAIGGVAFGMVRYNVLDLVPVARDVVVDTMSAGVLVLDRRQRVLDANPGAARLLGDEVENLLGAPLEHVFAAGAALISLHSGADCNNNRCYDLIEHRGCWLELSLTPLGDTKRPYGRLLVLRDVTEQVDTENALRRAVNEAEAANDAKVRLLATMSHELRTPLTGILGFSELLREELVGPLNEAQHDYVGNVLESGEHLLGLINDLLSYAKLEFGEAMLDVREVVVPDLLDEIIEALTPAMRQNTLLGDYSRGLGTIYTDPVQLKELLRHLLDNAAKFTHSGTVTLVARREDEALILSVRDTGIGIAPDYLPDLFKAFSQADTSYTRHYGGSGIGLALVGHICRLLGGTITVDSTLGEGSSFTVRLPVDVREASPPAARDGLVRVRA